MQNKFGRSLIDQKWGASRRSLLTIYRTFIRSRLDYIELSSLSSETTNRTILCSTVSVMFAVVMHGYRQMLYTAASAVKFNAIALDKVGA